MNTENSALRMVPPESGIADPRLEPAPREERLLVSAKEVARLCGVSPRTWWRLDSAGRVPKGVKLGGRKLWRARELAEFTNAGCPPRKEWSWIKEAAK